MAIEKYRARVHMLLLYPDDPSHSSAFDEISKSHDYAAILHNRDTWTSQDAEDEPDRKEGELKKPHYHVVLRTKNATWNTALCEELGIEDRFCRRAKNIDNALQYLLHYNDADKPLYDISEVSGPLRTKLNESIKKIEKSEGEKVCELIDYIQNYEGRLRITEFARYCAHEGYWSEFRRAGVIFSQIISEHNYKFDEAMQSKKAFGMAREAEYIRAELEGKQIEDETVTESFEQIDLY